jgi:hypothetical protein
MGNHHPAEPNRGNRNSRAPLLAFQIHLRTLASTRFLILSKSTEAIAAVWQRFRRRGRRTLSLRTAVAGDVCVCFSYPVEAIHLLQLIWSLT